MQRPHLVLDSLTGSWRRLSSAFLAFAIVFATIPVELFLFPQIARAEAVTVNCSGTAGSPTAVTEADLAGDDVTFSNTGGDGYCVLDAAISANSVVVGLGVVLTHAAEDSTGVNITTTGNLTLTGEILVSGKGCAGGAESTDGRGPNTSTGVCAATTSGYGDASRGGAGHGGPGGAASLGGGTAGIKYGSPLAPTLLGSGGAGGPNGGETGGAGGGKVRLDVGGTLFVDGAIKANGNAPPVDQAAGGGSGGTIYITTNILDTTSGTGAVVQANGGNAYSHGGAGGGGRVAVYYDTLASDGTNFALTNITSTKGAKGTFGNNGEPGSTFILNRKTDDGAGNVRVITGLDLADGADFARTNITLDSGSTITCDAQTTLNFTATGNFTDNGSTFNCTAAITTANITATDTLTTAGVNWDFTNTTTVNLSAATWTSSGTNTIDVTKAGSAMDWNVTNALTLNNLTYTGATPGTSASTGGVLSMDNAIAVSLVNTDINSNLNWTGLSSLSVDADSSISANGKGCGGGPQSGDGYGPDTSSGVCTQSTSGYGANQRIGAGHGGAGGRSNQLASTGATYGSSTAPVLYGSGGGGGANGGETGGAGGGKIRLDVTGTFTLNGTLSSNGSGPADNAGGGSGGSVYVSMGTLAGSGTANSVAANGGAGIANGGGGGGGRIALSYGTSALSSGTINSMMQVNGGASGGTGAAAAGSAGSTNNADLPIFSSALYKDSDANGTVDQLVLTFDESVSLGGTVASTRFTWTSASGANGSAGTLSGNASASGTDVTITIDSAEANETGATTVPTIAYSDNSDDGTNKIQDTDGNIVQTFSAQNVSDGAKPVVITKQYQDVDANGTVERVLLTLSENASTQTAVLGDFAYVASDITGSALAGGTLAYPASNQVGLLLGTAGNANITGHTTAPTIAYTDGGSTAIADAAGNQLATFAAANLSDGAAPIITTRQYEDSDGNGTVDRLSLALSEAASTQTAVLGDFAYTAGSITGSAISGGTLSYPSSTAMRIVLGTAGNSGITSHATAPTIAYTDGGATAVADAAGNQLATFSAASVSDAAGPAFVSARTTSTTNVRLTMSEAVSSATFGAAGGWTGTGLTPSAVAINSDTTKLDLTVSALNRGYTASDFAFTSGVSGSAISDAASNATASFTSKTIADGLAPDAPGSFTRSTGSGTTATFTWTATSDTNFNHYEVWYGTNSTDVTNRNGTASEWDNDPNDANLATRTTTTTTVTGLTAGSTYYALICAVDNASNETCSSSVSFVTNQAPTAATVTGSQATDGTGNVTVSFIMDDPDDDNTLQALVEYSTNGGTSWSKATLNTTASDITSTYGTPRVDNSATYQVGKASNYITSSSGANTVTVKWQSATDAPTADVANAKIRVTPYDGVVAGTAASSSNFALDNVDPSAPVVSSATTALGAGATWDTTITGTKDASTAIRNNGTQVVASNSSTTWSYNVVLIPGNNVYSFTAMDANGNVSTAASHTIVYTQGQGGSGSSSTSSGSSGTSTTTATTTTTSSTPTPSTTATVTPTATFTAMSGEAEVKPVFGETDFGEEDEDEDGRGEIRPMTVTPVVPGPKPILDQTKQIYPLAPQTPVVPSVRPPVQPVKQPVQSVQPSVPTTALTLPTLSFSPTGILSQLQEQLKEAGIQPTLPGEVKPAPIPELKPSTIEFFQPDPVKAQQKVEAAVQFLAEFNSALTEMFVAQVQPVAELAPLPGVPSSIPSTSLSLGGPLLSSAPEAPVVVAQALAPVLPPTRLDLYVDQTVSREYQRIVENTDEDILPDWWEKRYGGGDTATMNERTDLDGDGVDDLAEFMLGTDPTNADSDGDGVSDKDEIKRGTNATAWDTDGDGVSDSAELARGTDPKKFDKVAVTGDNDGDGVPDDWARQNQVKVEGKKKSNKVTKEVKLTFAMTDSDNDGLTDADELKNGTNPNVRDSDGDGVSDGAEVHDYRTNPTAVTATKELEKTQLSNVKNNRAVFADAKPMLRGTSKPNSKVTLVFMPTQEQPKTLGQLLFAAAVNSTMGGLITKEVETDSQGKFLAQPKLKDGTYSVIVRSSDVEGNPTEESLPYQIHIATELVKKALVSLSQLDNVLVDSKSGRRMTLDSREPVLYGKMDEAGKGYELVALWKSNLQTVSMVVDNEDGEFMLSPSEPLEDGDHNLYVYAEDPVTSVQTAAVSLDFRVLAEQDYVSVDKRFNWILNILAFFAAGAVLSLGARRLRRARRSA